MPSPYFLTISITALLIQSTALFLCLVHVTKTSSSKFNETTKNFTKKIVNLFSKWYPWHVFGGILVSLPILVILSNSISHSASPFESSPLSNNTFNFIISNEEVKKLTPNVELRDDYYTLLILIGLVHFCNFTQLNFFMKSILALITGIIYLVIINNANCQYHNKSYISAIFVTNFLKENFLGNSTEGGIEILTCCSEIITSLTDFGAQNYYNAGMEFLNSFYNNSGLNEKYRVTESGYDFLFNLNETAAIAGSKEKWLTGLFTYLNNEILNYDTFESILNVFIILLLVILLNREFEISYRLSYYCNTESNKDKMRVQNMKDQADWLLENIIPKHVSRELKCRAKYCENHSNVGIIFASIVNFNKLYDETYSGGKEYLRVLNELISDFDELLDDYKNVDKIKTIGSTFMGASGLNPELRKQNKSEYEHIFELMDFALKMYRVVDVFNRDLLGFNLILRVGFNIGEVTAGVIGSSKLFYDIWGDAVNVASRMDSTGVDGRIQVPFSSLAILSQRYNFEPRGSVYVKGKGDILVYLLKE